MQIDSRLPEIDDCLYRLSVRAIIIKDKQLLLVQEADVDWWSLPGGGIDYGETIEQALKREVAEELGVNSQSLRFNKQIFSVQLSAAVNGIPRANLFYEVNIPPETIKPTDHVATHGWFSAETVSKLHKSPSTEDIIEQLKHSLIE